MFQTVAIMTSSALAAMPRGPRRLRYQAQDCSLTLAQGLAEYYGANVGRVTPPEALNAASEALFARHDICHVIFGLDTTIADEAMVDTRAMLSCDVGFQAYADHLRTNPDVKAVFRETGYLKSFWTTLLTVPRLIRAWNQASRMHRKWPWTPPAGYLRRTLADLRAEFGIRVI